ncbi:ABC transporter substrate-binding protein [Glycomyces arizonensis]|uniref:ABC transporter substrate-binding protein n=1 Tax=Glycomyces arizonensis TaxID=256035 RepID=UPI0004291883|nr:ABC transporter substrate-binding protein [Glycomyces arizonensis]
MKHTNPSGLSRRTLAKAGLFGAAAAPLLAACGKDEGESGELTMMWWGSEDRHEYTRKIIAAFEKANDGVSIEESVAEWGGYWDALNVSVSGGNTPDVMQHEERYLREYAERDTLLALDDIGIDFSNLDPAVLSGGQLDGKTYGIGTGVNALCLLLNPAIVEEAGLEVPDDKTWSWADFAAFVTEISSKTDKVGNSAVSFNNEALFNIFARQKGESLYTPEGALGFTPETMTEWWTMVTDLLAAEAIPSAEAIVESAAAGKDQSPLATGTGASEFYWTNQVGGLEELVGSELLLLRVPGETSGPQPGLYLKPAMFWAAGADTNDKETVGKLIDFLLNSDESIDLTLTDRGLPANLEQRERILPDLPDADKRGADFITELTPDLVEGPPVPPIGAGQIPDIMLRVYEPLLFGDLTPETATEQFLSEAESAIG